MSTMFCDLEGRDFDEDEFETVGDYVVHKGCAPRGNPKLHTREGYWCELKDGPDGPLVVILDDEPMDGAAAESVADVDGRAEAGPALVE